LENSVWRRLWTCRKTGYNLKKGSFQPHFGPGDDSTSNRNEYQESSCAIRLKTSPPLVSRLSTENVGASLSHNPMGLHGLLQC
jgi:hypothetical protein